MLLSVGIIIINDMGDLLRNHSKKKLKKMSKKKNFGRVSVKSCLVINNDNDHYFSTIQQKLKLFKQ